MVVPGENDNGDGWIDRDRAPKPVPGFTGSGSDRLGVGFWRNILILELRRREGRFMNLPEASVSRRTSISRLITTTAVLCGMHQPKVAIGSSYASPTMTQAAAPMGVVPPTSPTRTIKLFLAGDVMTGRGIDQVGHARVMSE